MSIKGGNGINFVVVQLMTLLLGMKPSTQATTGSQCLIKSLTKAVNRFVDSVAIRDINRSQIMFKQNKEKVEKEADEKLMKFIKLNAIKEDKYDKSVENMKYLFSYL